MQNLTTTLLDDNKKHKLIILPSKKAKFNWIDICDISEICSKFIIEFEGFKNSSYDITGTENLDFNYVTQRINAISEAGITYKAVSPLRFIFFKIHQGSPLGMIFVLCMLHFLPRIQKEPEISQTYKNMTGKEPTKIDEFIRKNIQFFTC